MPDPDFHVLGPDRFRNGARVRQLAERVVLEAD